MTVQPQRMTFLVRSSFMYKFVYGGGIKFSHMLLFVSTSQTEEFTMMADKDPKIERTVTLTTSDDDMLLETPPDEEVTHDLDNKGFAAPRKRRLVIVLGFAAILLILAVALTVFFALVKKPSNNDDGGVVSNTPTRTPVTGTSPISVPTASLTPLPTLGPTASPTPITPATPTAPPTADPKADLKRFVNQVVDMAVMDTSTLKDPTSPQYLAREWLIHSDNGIWASTENGPMMAERYAMAVLDIALAGELSVRTPTLHVCDWLGVECEEISEERIEGVSTRKQIRQINWARRGLTGSLPEEIVLVQEYLWKLDLAENDMIGALPEMFYSLTNLTHVYLHNNRLSGAISESGIANMPQLVNVYFGHNQFTGTIPSTWASIRQGQFSKPLRKCLDTFAIVSVDYRTVFVLTIHTTSQFQAT